MWDSSEVSIITIWKGPSIDQSICICCTILHTDPFQTHGFFSICYSGAATVNTADTATNVSYNNICITHVICLIMILFHNR